MAEGLFLGVGFFLLWAASPAERLCRSTRGLSRSAQFSERAHQLPALLWENVCARLAGGALDTTDSLLLCAYVSCVYT